MKTITENYLCRICLNVDKNKENDIRTLKFSNKSAIQVFEFLFGVKIKESSLELDNVPRQLCLGCQVDIKVAVKLKECAVKTNDFVAGIELGEVIQIKEEPPEDTEETTFFNPVDSMQNHPVITIDDSSSDRAESPILLEGSEDEDVVEETPFVNQAHNGIGIISSKPQVLLGNDVDVPKIKPKLSQPAKFQCEICYKIYKSAAALKHHKNAKCCVKEKRNENFLCEFCPSTFQKKRVLKAHLMKHFNIRNFKCNVCFKLFSAKQGLDYHLLRHNNIRDFKCSVCSKKLFTSQELKLHMKRHNNIRDFKCTFCSKSFVTLQEVKQHLAVHSDEKPVKCKYCSKSVKRKVHLQRHYSIHHPHKDQ